jgi:hypothetical protein
MTRKRRQAGRKAAATRKCREAEHNAQPPPEDPAKGG